jgi:hypothetical protein
MTDIVELIAAPMNFACAWSRLIFWVRNQLEWIGAPTDDFDMTITGVALTPLGITLLLYLYLFKLVFDNIIAPLAIRVLGSIEPPPPPEQVNVEVVIQQDGTRIITTTLPDGKKVVTRQTERKA